MEDLCALGLKQLKDIDSERAYYGIISSGNVQTERILNTEIMMDEEVLLEAAFPDETEFSLIWNNRLQALIAGETYGKKSKGLQVIVYDHVLHEVVEDAFSRRMLRFDMVRIWRRICGASWIRAQIIQSFRLI